MPALLIVFGIFILLVTIWDIRREEADMLFWMDCLWWDVNKTEHPILYRVAVVLQLSAALLMIGSGAIWLTFFR